VVKESELVEKGSHDELLAAGGLYAELYKIQTSEGESKLTEQTASK
jgi:ABC-type multidrug transport system fused ATPase/permease subunit